MRATTTTACTMNTSSTWKSKPVRAASMRAMTTATWNASRFSRCSAANTDSATAGKKNSDHVVSTR